MYNEELFIGTCIQHLLENDIYCYVIDNESVDKSVEIVTKYLNRGVIGIETLPRDGYFDLSRILRNEEKLAKQIDADWFIHQDADDIRMPPLPYTTLKEAIEDVNRQGYNAINFDEFVFMPTDEKVSFEGKDYLKEMHWYYFFEPFKYRLIKAWKKKKAIDLVRSGGHCVRFGRMRMFPVNFTMRHYIALSREQIIRKYCEKSFSEKELKRGWHGKRAIMQPEDIVLPPESILKKYNHDRIFEKENPWNQHYLFQEKEPTPLP